MRVSVEYAGLRDLQGRFQRVASEDTAENERAVRQATELVYRQAQENISQMFNNPGRMMNALQMTIDVIAGGARGAVTIDGVGYATQEFGGRGPYAIFPHGKALRFQGTAGFGSVEGGENIFAAYVLHPALPARSYLRLALEQKEAEIQELFAGRAVARFRE